MYDAGTGSYAYYFCDAYAWGGSGNYTFTWNTAGAIFVDVYSGADDESYAEVQCRGFPGSMPVNVTVRDGSGATATSQDRIQC